MAYIEENGNIASGVNVVSLSYSVPSDQILYVYSIYMTTRSVAWNGASASGDYQACTDGGSNNYFLTTNQTDQFVFAGQPLAIGGGKTIEFLHAAPTGGYCYSGFIGELV